MKNRIRKEFEEKDNDQEVRLNKFLSESGVCSRREADRLIESGRVKVDGQPAQMGMRVIPSRQEIRVGKKIVTRKNPMVLLAFHKPVGVECTAEKRVKNNIVDYIHYPVRIYPVGRLDKDSEGLILMTNNGDIVNKMMRAGNRHEKEYVVKVDRPVTEDFIRRMSEGVAILDTVTRPCKVKQVGKYTFRIVLTQGLNRQIRRMCEALGYEVKKLKRERIMNIELGNLKVGTYRPVTEKELAELDEMIRDSSNTTVMDRSEADE
jgi:23S rRNA pseudouridine2604 synthase